MKFGEAWIELAVGDHAGGGQYLSLDEVDERADDATVQEVDGAAVGEQIEAE